MEEEKFFSKLKTKSILIKAAALALTLLIGILIGFIQKDMLAEYEKRTFKYFEVRAGGYKFINPLLECRSASDAFENKELRPFKKKIEKFVKNKLDTKSVSNLAVYFRDLNNGPWFSIGPTANFTPASLLKVPLMIAILKEAELLQQRLNALFEMQAPCSQTITTERIVAKIKEVINVS